ncbi:hypothetical protein CLV51_10895 [Chitinophaga niastensis]|uniref:Uncharacterized protein n=1 Tax=Chitinophaga niastensis TaxID=536980 RepID=A0A2P8HAZ5_CHINA|nr:hypothetical protein CLV51_10895 [Chitinophaga niastensis]
MQHQNDQSSHNSAYIELYEWFNYPDAITRLWRITIGPGNSKAFSSLPLPVRQCFLTFTTLLTPLLQSHYSAHTDIVFCTCEPSVIELSQVFKLSQADMVLKRMYTWVRSLPEYRSLPIIEIENDEMFFSAVQGFLHVYYILAVTEQSPPTLFGTPGRRGKGGGAAAAPPRSV